jgi:hypothetical protein
LSTHRQRHVPRFCLRHRDGSQLQPLNALRQTSAEGVGEVASVAAIDRELDDLEFDLIGALWGVKPWEWEEQLEDEMMAYLQEAHSE